jgi:RNA polymerase sigma-70 factor (ECF subfamily)
MAYQDGVTRMGGSGREFPSTLWTAVRLAQDSASPDSRTHLETLISHYWKPVYWVIRFQWNRTNEEAKDLTQEFFSRFLEKDYVRDFSPDRGRFRTFVRATLHHFMLNHVRDSQTVKRGGGAVAVPLEGVEEPVAPNPSDEPASEEGFDRVWAQALMSDAVEAVRGHYEASGRQGTFSIFESHDLADGPAPPYAELALRFGVTEDSVRGALRRVRSDLREVLRGRILASVSNPEELGEELRHLFGNASEPS